jgi:hypothetical protein
MCDDDFNKPDLQRVQVLLGTLPELASGAKCDWLAVGTRHSMHHTEKNIIRNLRNENKQIWYSNGFFSWYRASIYRTI